MIKKVNQIKKSRKSSFLSFHLKYKIFSQKSYIKYVIIIVCKFHQNIFREEFINIRI